MKLLICDDHELFRSGLKQLIIQHNNKFEVMEATNLIECYQQCDRHQFDLVLLDLNMPDSNGVVTLPEVCRRAGAPILVVSADDRPETIQMTLKQGIVGYLPKSTDSQTIVSVIDKVLAGEKCFPQQVQQATELKGQTSLNPRQIEILQCLVEGMSNQQIAEKINLSEGTVRQYVTIILRCLGVDNRTQAANVGRKLLKEYWGA